MESAEILNCIHNAFPVFFYGERHLQGTLSGFAFDPDGMKRQSDWYKTLSRNVFKFLEDRFPELGSMGWIILHDLQMSSIREKIERSEDAYELYCSITSKYAFGAS